MLVAWATVSVRISGLGMAVKILCLCQIVLNLQSCKRQGQIGPIFIFLWAFFDCNSIPAMERSAGNLDQVWRKLRQNTNSERDIEISHFQPDSQTVQVVRGFFHGREHVKKAANDLDRLRIRLFSVSHFINSKRKTFSTETYIFSLSNQCTVL